MTGTWQSRTHPEAGTGKRPMTSPNGWPSLVVGTGVDPVTFRFSGGRSAN